MADLSKETIEWLEEYKSFLPEDQLAISAVPACLNSYDTSGEVARSQVNEGNRLLKR